MDDGVATQVEARRALAESEALTAAGG
jgi:hypothetical protein